MATIREKRPGVWEVRVFTGRDELGRPTQASRTVRGGKRDAQKLAARLEAKPTARSAGRTVADVLSAWMESNEGAWAPATVRDHRLRARQITTDRIGRVSLARLSVADVERWHARMRAAGVGESAIVNRHKALRAALSQAVRWEWVSTNVAAAAKLAVRRKPPRESMTDDEVRAVLEAARVIGPAVELALRLAAVTGARRAELAALRWDDVEGERLRIDSSVSTERDDHGAPQHVDAPTKTANVRRVRLDDATSAMIDAQRAERGAISPYVFGLDERPPPPARIGWWWERARSLAGIDTVWRLHDLRHWSATTAIAGGHDVRTVAGRLGHANAAMTLRIYAHALETADEAVAAKLGGVLDEQPNRPHSTAPGVRQSRRMDVLARFGVEADTIAAFCRRNGIRRLAAFGSVLRDDFGPDSDIDLLVEFEAGEKVSLFDMARMELELEEIVLGRRVDLRTAGDLGRRFRDRVMAEAQPVYDAAA